MYTKEPMIFRPKIPRLIGLTGRAGCGKDTVADYLTWAGYQKYALAGPIKAGLNAMFGFTDEDWTDRSWKEAPQGELAWRSPRYLAQTLGTEWGRALVADDIWLRLFERAWNKLRCETLTVGMVVTDVRFANEAALIRRLGGAIVEIQRPGAAAVEAHSSEEGVPADLIDVVVVNNSTPHTLFRNFIDATEDYYIERLASRE